MKLSPQICSTLAVGQPNTRFKKLITFSGVIFSDCSKLVFKFFFNLNVGSNNGNTRMVNIINLWFINFNYFLGNFKHIIVVCRTSSSDRILSLVFYQSCEFWDFSIKHGRFFEKTHLQSARYLALIVWFLFLFLLSHFQILIWRTKHNCVSTTGV